MIESKYKEFKRLRDEDIRLQQKEAQLVADKAFNRGVWDAVKWRNPLAYFVLKRNIRESRE